MIDIGKPTQCMICPPNAAGTCNRDHNRTEHQPSIVLDPPTEKVVEYNYSDQPPMPQDHLVDEDGEDEEIEDASMRIPVFPIMAALVAIVVIVLAVVVGVTFSDDLQVVNLMQFQSDYAPTQ